MSRITIIGTGWTEDQLTLGAVERLRGGGRIILHTDRCGCAAWLKAQGIAFEALDGLYATCEDFDEHIQAVVSSLLAAARDDSLVYCVADVRDRTVSALLESGADAVVMAGPPAEGALLALASGETLVSNASDWETLHCAARQSCLIRELDSRELAAELKLKLMERYPEELMVWLLNGDSAPVQLPLYALDRGEVYDHRTCVLVPAEERIAALERYDFEHLMEIMRILCGPNGCPWDRVQTHESLRPYLLEEAYEVIDAIDSGDPNHLYDELGDVLLQVALHAEIGRRHGEFDISDVTTAICEKMISRHSHVFGTDSAADEAEVTELWRKNKMEERGIRLASQTLFEVTRALPAQLRAAKVLRNSHSAGLGDDNVSEPLRRCAEWLERIPGAEDPEAAIGAAMLNLVGAARFMQVDPEIALNRAVDRFIERFQAVEARALGDGTPLEEACGDTLRNLYWDSVKL